MNAVVGEGVLDWFKKRHERVGQRELSALTKQAKNNFSQLMGRNGQTWKTVTWDTLFKYLTIQNQLGLAREQVMKMFNDPELIQKGKQAAQLVNALDPATFNKNVWGTKGQLIGFPVDKNTEKRANAIVSMFLQLAATFYLNRKAQADEMPDAENAPEHTPDETPTPDKELTPGEKSTAEPIPTPPSTETPTPTPPTPTGDKVKDDRGNAIYNLELALSKLRG